MTMTQYKNPPSRNDLIDIIKRAFVNMGYDTEEKRKEWHRNQRSFVFWATEIPEGCKRNPEGS